MGLPKIDTARLEREGVAVVMDLAARPRARRGLGFIFRELATGDVGIDGLLEVVDASTGEATGRFVGVQVKAGPSYFRRRSRKGGWAIRIRKSTARYWRQYSVPVILVAVDVDARVAYWALVSAGDFHETRQSVTIPLVEAQRFDVSAADAIAALAEEPPPWLAARLREVTEELSRATSAELKRHRDDWREGRRRAARDWLEGWVSTPLRLRALTPPVAASLLRFGASVSLDANSDEATALARLEEARRVDPSGDDPTAAETRIRAAVLARRGNVDGALDLLQSAPGVAARHLRASLLLAHGRPAEVEFVLDATDAPARACDEGDNPSDEANGWRLRALARLALGEMGGAAAAADRARALAPRHLLTRWTWAALAYLRVLVPEAVPAELGMWPPTVREEYLLRDPAALAALSDAAAEFAGVLDADLEPEERRQFEAWRLAALAGSPDRAPAAAYAADVLLRDPAHPYVILWAAHENLPLDLGPHLEALSDEAERTGDVDGARYYAAARLEAGRVDGLAEWLDTWRARFEARGDCDNWALLHTRTLVALGALDEARAALDQVSPVLRPPLEADIAAAEASRASGDPGSLVARLEDVARRTGDAHFLLEACRAAAYASDWSFVARHADELLRRFPTPPVRRMAIIALFRTRDDDACLALITNEIARGVPGADDRELRRIRAEVHARTGRVPEAAAAFEQIVAEAGPAAPTPDLLRLAQLHFILGRPHELATAAARLRARDDLSTEGALMLAEVLAHDDPPLACELWERAVALSVPDALVTKALALGYRLGLDTRLHALSARMVGLAASGSPFVRQFTFEELLAHGEDRARHRAHVLALYARGETPTHLVAEVLGEPLSHLYHVVPEASAQQTSPRHAFAVQLRDGGRGVARLDAAFARPGRLALDLSALLLAHHLRILPQVESQFAPLRLPHVAVAALQDLRDRLHPHQPSRAETTKRLLEAERLGWIEQWAGELPALDVEEESAAGSWVPWVSLLERARREGAFVVDLPLEVQADEPSPHDRPAVVAGDMRLTRLISVPVLRRRLRALGAARPSGGSAEEADEIDGGWDGAPEVDGTAAGPEPPRGAVLYLTDAGADALASAGLLQSAAEFFTLRVDPDEQAARHAHRQDLDAFAERANWIEGLIRRVAEGLIDGRYALLPERRADSSTPDSRGSAAKSLDGTSPPGGGVPSGGGAPEVAGEGPDAAEGDSPASSSLSLQFLVDLISLPPDTVDAVWIDDRYINRHRLAGATRIVDVLEVLGALNSAGLLTSEQRFAHHTELRAGSIRVIPLGADELTHHLQAAPIEHGELVETRALRILRQYSGSLLADAPSLRVPGPAELAAGFVGDLELLRGHAAAVKEALVEAWRPVRDPADRATLKEAEARSRWLVRNLYVDLGLLRARVVHPDQPPEPRLSALDAASLFLSAALQLLPGGDRVEPKRSETVATAFTAWFDAFVVAPRAERDSTYRRAVAVEIRRVLAEWPARDALSGGAPNTLASPEGCDVKDGKAASEAAAASRDDDVEYASEGAFEVDGELEDQVPSTSGGSSKSQLALLVARHLAGRAYDTLPEAWKEEVARDQTLMKFLGRGVVSALSVGRYDVEPDSFAAAAAAALAGTPSMVSVLGEVTQSSLLLSSADGASLTVTPSDSDDAFLLQNPAFGVLVADHAARRAAFTSARRQADFGAREWRAKTEPMVADEDPARRLLAIFDCLQSALPRRYHDLQARWRDEQRLHADDLRPPSTASLRSHFRLDLSSALTLEDWERAARTLIEEDGVDTALERLAGIPVPAPESLLDALSVLTPGMRRAILHRTLRRPCSPIAAVNLLSILSRLSRTEPRYLRWTLRLLRRVGTDDWKAWFALLRSLTAAAVQATRSLGDAAATDARVSAQSTDSAESTKDAEDPDPAGALLAAWYHAHRLVTTAAALGIDPTSLARHVRHRVGRADSLFAPSDLRHDEAHPASSAYARFVVAGLQHATLGTVLANQTAALKEALGALFRSASAPDEVDHADGSIPEVELLRDARGRSNLTGSWFPLARHDDGAVTIGEIVVVAPTLAPDAVISEALDKLAGDASAPEGWWAIAVVAGPEPLTGAHAERFEQIASTLEVPALLRRLGDKAPLAAGRLARQSLAPEATQRRHQLREALLAAVREDREGARNASPRRVGDTLSDLQAAVIEALYVLAGAEPRPSEAMSIFAHDLHAVGRTDAAYLRHFRPLVEELVRTRPLDEAHALTALLGASRAT